MRKNTALLLLVGGALLLAPPARAFLFGRKEAEPREGKATRRYHLHIPDARTEKELFELFQWKNTVTTQVRVMGELIGEKAKELAVFNKGLQDGFAVKPDRNYRYDAQARTLFEIVSQRAGAGGEAAAGAGAKSGVEQRRHMVLTNDVQVRAFAQLTASKQIAEEEIRVFELVLREKQAELANVDKLLAEKFSISRDRSYQYDTKTMRLYEIIAAPQRAEPPPQIAPSVSGIEFR